MSKQPESPEINVHLPKPHGVGATLRNRLVAGVLTLIPIAVTIFLVTSMANWVRDLYAPLTNWLWEEYFRIDLQHKQWINLVISFLLTFIVIYLVGLMSSIYIGRRLIALGESILRRIPVIKTIYGTIKQITDVFSQDTTERLKKVVLIEYPRRNIYAMAFVTGETRVKDDPRTYVNLFVPTTPNPTSGYLLVLPSEDVKETGLSIEVAFKFVISGGILELDNLPLSPYQSRTTREAMSGPKLVVDKG